MANDSFNPFVSSFVSFSINGLKENAANLNYYPIFRRKVELYLFLSTHREWESFLCRFLQMLSTAATIKVSIVYLQSSLPCELAGTYNFRKYLPSSFLHKLTSTYRQNWSCEKIPKSQNSDKVTSFSSVVVNIALSVQKVSYSKPLHNNSRCLNTMKSFLAFKVISTWIFVYFQKGFTYETLPKHPVHDSDFVLLYIHRLAQWI